jgi:hypothetical protein
MKKNIICSAAVVIIGLLIAFGPQFLFKICGGGCSCCGDIPGCYWAGRAEIGMGLIIAALGLCLLVFPNVQTQLGLAIGIFLTGLFALLIPHVIIGGCEMKTMACHKVAFPALTIESAILLALSAVMVIIGIKKSAGGTKV